MILNNCSELKQPGKGRTVIVGGGTVGLYAAVLLARQGRDVVVVEAGGIGLGDFDPHSYACTGRDHQGIRLGRSKSIGGTSNLWGGQLVEYQPVDFEGRDWLPGSKWPVSYAEISRYYRPTYEQLGIPARFQSDATILDQVLGGAPAMGDGVEMFLTRWLKIPSIWLAFESEIRSNARLSVLLNHTTVGFLGSGNTIDGIRVRPPDGPEQTITGDTFILASGTIEISRLLLHAAADPAWKCPWRGNPNIGAFFQDHIGGRVAAAHPVDRKRFFNTFCTIVQSGQKFQPKLRLSNQTLKDNRVLNVQGMFSFESSISENLVFLKQFLKAAIYSRKITGIGDLFSNLRACGKHLVPLMWKYVVDNRIFVPSSSKISFMVQSEQSPLPECRMTIDAASPDAHGLPKVLLDWKIGEEELVSIRAFALRCRTALSEAGLADLEISKDLLNMEGRFLAGLRDNYHHVGGARMGSSKEDGVVDANLRVFETENLFVTGAASFRTTSNANTTFVAMAFVTRLVEHLTSRSPEHPGVST